MEIHIGSDHRGFAIKAKLSEYLDSLGYSCTDHGTHNAERTDYPLFAKATAEAVVKAEEKGTSALGIVICGSGVGIAIPANKVKGARCVVAWCEHVSEYGRRHNHANVIAFGTDVQTFTQIRRCVDAYLGAERESDRHADRVRMIAEMED